MTTLRKVKCPDCGKTANYADEYGPAFARRICGCDPLINRRPGEMESVRAMRLQRERKYLDLERHLAMPPSCGMADTVRHLAERWADTFYGLDYLNALRHMLNAPPALQWTSTPPSEPGGWWLRNARLKPATQAVRVDVNLMGELAALVVHEGDAIWIPFSAMAPDENEWSSGPIPLPGEPE